MKSSQGVIFNRREKIFHILKTHKQILVKELAEKMEVSEITIRRDLKYFENQALIERFYGGAKLIDSAILLSEQQKIYKNYPTKKRNIKSLIANKASQMIKTENTVFINSGSTAFQLFNNISKKDIIIVTNNGKVINQLDNHHAHIILSGGEIYNEKHSLIGDFAINSFVKVSADICFLGVGGINDKGITTFSLPETTVNKTILERTKGPRVVLAEGKKIGVENNFVTSNIDLITHLITDQSANKEEIKKLENKGVKITYADRK